MEVEQSGRGSRRARLRRRGTDQLEDVVAWALVVLALLVGLLALMVGTGAHTDAIDRSTAERAQRTPVTAVLLERVELTPAADGVSEVSPRQARVSWTGPGGAISTGEASVSMTLPAGAEIRLWVDRSGQVVRAPVTATGAAAAGWLAGAFTAIGGWVVLALLWRATRWATAAANAGRWAREWAMVEPEWSGRPR